MRRKINGSFLKPTPGNVNLIQDLCTIQGPFSPVWSSGKTAAVTIAPSPQINSNYTLLSVTISGYLQFLSATQPFGKLGTIPAGLSVDSPLQIPSPTETLPAYQQLPDDLSLVATMFDPAADPLPPTPNGNTFLPGNALPISATISPPVPLDIIAGVQIDAGIWLNPSLLGSSEVFDSLGLYLNIPSYCMIYDDGLG